MVERGAQPGQAQFVGAEGAGQRVAFELGDDLGPPDQDAGLWPAQQLIAAETGEVSPGGHALARRRLMVEAVGGGVQQRAAAQVINAEQAARAGDLRQFGQRRLLDEADLPEIGRMHAQQQRGLVSDGAGVIGGAGAIGGAHLDQFRAALGHDIGHAEAAADLDELTARDDHLAPGGQPGQHQHGGGGVVVDHQRVFGPGDLAQQGGGVDQPTPARAGLQVVFQRAVAGRHGAHGADGRLRQRGAA
jgi:hypothetical protein